MLTVRLTSKAVVIAFGAIEAAILIGVGSANPPVGIVMFLLLLVWPGDLLLTQRLTLKDQVLRLEKLLPTRGVLGKGGQVDLAQLIEVGAVSTSSYPVLNLKDSAGGHIGICKFAPWPKVEVWGGEVLEAANTRQVQVDEDVRYLLRQEGP